MPIVDSSDRSIRPQIRISAWPSTSRLSSEDCWTTLIRLPRGEEDRRDDEADHHQHQDHRYEREVAPADVGPAPPARRVSRTPAGLGSRTGHGRHSSCLPAVRPWHPSIAATSSRSVQPLPNSATTRPWNSASTRSHDPQVVELVGDDHAPRCPRRPPAAPRRAASPWTSRRRPRWAAGRPGPRGSRASARATTTFCWLPPERPETGCSGPAVLMSSDADHATGANSRVRDGQYGPPGAELIGDRERGVLRDAAVREPGPGGAGPPGCSRCPRPGRAARCPASPGGPRTATRPGVGRAHPGEGLAERGVAAGRGPGDAEHLAGAHRRGRAARTRRPAPALRLRRTGLRTDRLVRTDGPPSARRGRAASRTRPVPPVIAATRSRLGQVGDRCGQDVAGVAVDGDRRCTARRPPGDGGR